ncbi:hypothetical protein [Dongia sp.]|uniref:hypothetical protein n=1 Tax=Dongia sp. TaxID=1977262 RepID=UPI00375384C1
MAGGAMSRCKSPAASRRVAPMPPLFRARSFTDAGGKQRFGISVAVNGNRFSGSVLMRKDNRADPGGVAQLLESLASFVRGE